MTESPELAIDKTRLHEEALRLDHLGETKKLAELRKTCVHEFGATWEGFDRCEICGQPGEWEAR